MKKALIIFLCVLILIVTNSSTPNKACAFGVRVGAYCWFSGWEPMFKEWMLSSTTSIKLARIQKDYYSPPTLLYGPILVLDFTDRVSLSTIFSVGKFRFRASVLEIVPFFTSTISSHPDIGIYKYDLDSALNIRMNSLLKFFWGIKYQRYYYEKADLLQEKIGSASFPRYTEDKIAYHGLSTGLGMGFNVNLVKDLHFIWNISGLYQKPIIIRKHTEFLSVSPNIVRVPTQKQIPDYNALGTNSTLAFAYNIVPVSTTISIGARYQYLYTFGKDERGFDLNKKSDHFYGLTMAAIYSYQTSKE